MHWLGFSTVLVLEMLTQIKNKFFLPKPLHEIAPFYICQSVLFFPKVLISHFFFGLNSWSKTTVSCAMGWKWCRLTLLKKQCQMGIKTLSHTRLLPVNGRAQFVQNKYTPSYLERRYFDMCHKAKLFRITFNCIFTVASSKYLLQCIFGWLHVRKLHHIPYCW